MDFMESVLIIGNGAREHALAKALLRSDRPLCLYACPGNPGMEDDGCMLIDSPNGDWSALADWAVQNDINLTVVGPEIPLTEGIVDIFRKKKLDIFGPTKNAAQIEGSKSFAKDLMARYGIPTAAFCVFNDKPAALNYLAEQGVPIVVKASGLAAGKGAFVCDTMEEALRAIETVFDKDIFGEAGSEVVLEEKMEGEEASVFVLCDGTTYRVLPVSQDHKRLGEKDTGPNTGGMGAYAPCSLVDNDLLATIENDIVIPTLDAMKQEGMPYTGLLYAGIMVTPTGPKVVEFNCRFGDPETQVVLPLVDCDWFEVLNACSQPYEGKLASVSLSIKPGYCVGVVMASGGYPGTYEKGKIITGISEAEDNKPNVDVYHAGTTRRSDKIINTSGGRVLTVSAWAETLADTLATVYEAVAYIDFESKVYRRDIAAKELFRNK
jgi:phosphoribosylamine--glycine ligase